jgi:DNA-binding winged helix-turn-helix (wHTH) protein
MASQLTSTDFRLAEWLVQPSLNRLSRGDTTVQVEPKLMDVLVYLADHQGEVVSKIDITDGVWPEVFITESVITRAIAGLRRALEDDAREPRFIETISKRGYRLMVPPETTAPVAKREVAPAGVVRTATSMSPAVPFVVGQWVKAERFYGRKRLLNEVLHGNRNWLWLLGTRRIGKTSVLKQLEYLAIQEPDLGYIPVFWDLQGAEEPGELHLDFQDALLDAGERLEACGIAVHEVTDDDLFVSLGRLRRSLRAQGLTLLLLCDEVEELIRLREKAPDLLRKLRRALQSTEGIRSVLASSGRLWALADHSEDTSPFLDGFAPPLYVGTLDDDEAFDLIRQVQLESEVRPTFDDGSVTAIADHCGNHPYLMQLLAKRTSNLGDFDAAVRQVACERTISHFFSVDLEVLTDDERELLLAVGLGSSAPAGVDEHPGSGLDASLHALLELGILRRGREGSLYLPNAFLMEWLRNRSS